jgi:nitrate/TMAO reductase-like tetraheme cytochrome c subunit
MENDQRTGTNSVKWRTLILFSLLIGIVAIVSRFVVDRPAPQDNTQALPSVRGRVLAGGRPLADARVRFKGQATSSLTDESGRFTLRRPSTMSTRITAWKNGYFIAGANTNDGPIELQLTALPVVDAIDYKWIDPAPDSQGEHNCANCHSQIYNEWSSSAHARSVSNRRFQNLVDGSDWKGRVNHGWNLMTEHPNGVAVCNSCHAPSVSFDSPANNDLRLARGVDSKGVHCDFCHKVKDATADARGLTHGRFGMQLLRPEEGQLFFGPLQDVDRGEDAYSPVYQQSRYCASCHEGVVFGVHVYSTYTEWLKSPARRQGKQCQSCHMQPSGRLRNIAPGKGGIDRDPATLASHRTPGGNVEMLKRCLTVKTRVVPSSDSVTIECTVTADRVGHNVPTGFIDRHLILVLDARDADGTDLVPLSGKRLPDLAGSPLQGRAGKLYAKQTRGLDGTSPVPFWRAQPDVIDTRLKPGQPDKTKYTFPSTINSLSVRLIYRRFWQAVAIEKGWPSDEIIVIEKEIDVNRIAPKPD